MKKNQLFKFALGMMLLSSIGSFAQKKLNLTVRYDKDFDRYEVFVKPNFSQKNFTWGPSQVSLVLPSNVLVEKLKIRNVDGGSWEDNSIVQAPEVSPEMSFHGVSSGGDKTNLVEDYESILFYFSLPNTVNSDKVRIWDNLKDPKSSAKGMMGGDFTNTIVDMTGKDWFNETYALEKAVEIKEEEKADFEATVYPNVITDNKFQISMKGLKEKDGDILMILADETGKEIFRQKGSKTILEKQEFKLKSGLNVQSLVLKVITSKGSISKRLVVEN